MNLGNSSGIEDLFPQIFSSELQSKLLPVKILLLLFSSGLLVLIIYLLRKTDWLKYSFSENLTEFGSFKAHETIEFVKKWEQAKKRLKKDWEAEFKLAVIEADKLLDDLLKRMGYVGESLGERLKQLNVETMANIDQIWEAHKIRNNIIHDPDYKLPFEKAEELIRIYEEAFNNLEAL